MPDHIFNMRLQTFYSGSDNQIDFMQLEHKLESEWQQLDIHAMTPGFSIFVYALLACQHQYFRVNCAEKGILLKQSRGELYIQADEQWLVRQMNIVFNADVTEGDISDANVAFVESRMALCPVSRNLRDVEKSQTRVELNAIEADKS